MGKKGNGGASQNDKIFDYIYDSTFWPEYMGDAVPLLGTGGLKEILKGSRSKREARNRLLLAYRKAQEDGGNGFGELMDNAVSEYADNYAQPGDAKPEFLWRQERLEDLDPTSTGVEDILGQAGNIAAALGYGTDVGSVEQMLSDLYGRNLEMKGHMMPTSRDFVESYGKLAEVLKNPLATDTFYRKVGIPFNTDPENLYEYVSGIADRANRIRLEKEKPLVVDMADTFTAPYSHAKNSLGRDANAVDKIADVLSLAATFGAGGAARKAGKGLKFVKDAGTNVGAGGAAVGLDAIIGGLHDAADSAATTHTYTTDENGNPDYTEDAKINWGSALGTTAEGALSGLAMLGLAGRNFTSQLLNKLRFDQTIKNIGKRIEPIKKKTVSALDGILDGNVNKKIANEKKLQARAEGQVEILSGKRSDLDALLRAEQAKLRKNPFGWKDPKREARMASIKKELDDIIAKGEKKQALANKHLKKAEELEAGRKAPKLLSGLGKGLGKTKDLAIIRAFQNGLIPVTIGDVRRTLQLMNSDDR